MKKLLLIAILVLTNTISATAQVNRHACEGPAALHNPHCNQIPQVNLETTVPTPQPTEIKTPDLVETIAPQPTEVKVPELLETHTPVTIVALPDKLMSVKSKKAQKHKKAIETFINNHSSFTTNTAKKIHKTINTDNTDILAIPVIHKEVSKWKYTKTKAGKKPYPVTVYHIEKSKIKKSKIKSKQKVKNYTSETTPTVTIQSDNNNNVPIKVHRHTTIYVDAEEYYEINKYEGILLSGHIDNIAPVDGIHTKDESVLVKFVQKF